LSEFNEIVEVLASTIFALGSNWFVQLFKRRMEIITMIEVLINLDGVVRLLTNNEIRYR
tara:strand:- start:10269 stop:10445 length:177 start_codon:yes stop_codon:yes gene_type:complete